MTKDHKNIVIVIIVTALLTAGFLLVMQSKFVLDTKDIMRVNANRDNERGITFGHSG